MDNSLSKKDKCCAPIKKIHKICDKCVIVIDHSIVERLRIDENETWFEQEQTTDGIFLKIYRPLPKED